MNQPVHQPPASSIPAVKFAAGGPHFAPDRLRQDSGSPDSTGAKHSNASLDSLQSQLRLLLQASVSRSDLLSRLTRSCCEFSNAIWCGQFQKKPDQAICSLAEFNGVANRNLGVARSSLVPTAEWTIAKSSAKVTRSGPLTVIAVPVFSVSGSVAESELAAEKGSARDDVTECLCLALNAGETRVEPFVLMLQLFASAIEKWDAEARTRRLSYQVEATAAIAELASSVASVQRKNQRKNQAAIVATNKLAAFLKARMVAIGLTERSTDKRTRVAAISGTTDLDRGGKMATLFQSALNETLVRGTVTTLPTIGDDDRCMKLAHQKVLSAHPGTMLVSSPLTTSGGKTIGAWIGVLPDDDVHHQRTVQFAEVASEYLADALEVSKHASAGPVARFVKLAGEFAAGKTGMIVAAATLLIGLVMAIPVPHRVSCRCQLEPTVRRFAVAPYDGILVQSLVKPGEMVTQGQTLARMDDRELRLRLEDLNAQREAAIKRQDVGRAGRDAAATKIAGLELEQIEAQINLAQFRRQNLEIKSAIAGIVLAGDLDEAQGAPVRTGDVLMEIAPLNRLKLKIDVPESDIRFVSVGQKASIVLDGNPFEKLTGEIESVSPMSEVRDHQNVFISELTIDNTAGTWKPGMRGRASIAEKNRALGWVLFHRAYERVSALFY